MRRGHPLAGRKRITPGDLVDYPVIAQFLPNPYRAWFAEVSLAAAAERKGCRVNLAHQCSDYSLLRRIALLSDAVMLSADRNILTSTDADRFTRLKLEMTITEYRVSVARLESAPPSPLAERLIELLQEASKESPR